MVEDSATFMKVELNRISEAKGEIHNVRGVGTFLAFDVDSPLKGEILENWMQHTGINMYRSTPTTFSMRPALIFEPKHGA
jgi:acetylornithine/succinyldiaminopimelate/putrescine aminotransferase